MPSSARQLQYWSIKQVDVGIDPYTLTKTADRIICPLLFFPFYIFHNIGNLTFQNFTKNVYRMRADAFISLEPCDLRRTDVIADTNLIDYTKVNLALEEYWTNSGM